METYYLIVITIIAVVSISAVYFIAKANITANRDNAEANRRIVQRLANALVSQDTNEYILANEADNRAEVKPENKLTSREAQSIIPMEEMNDDDWDTLHSKD